LQASAASAAAVAAAESQLRDLQQNAASAAAERDAAALAGSETTELQRTCDDQTERIAALAAELAEQAPACSSCLS